MNVTPKMQKAMDKAKMGLMAEGSVFIITLAFSMKHVFTEDVKTADVDGKTIRYNPEWFMELTPRARIFLMAHEAWHVALNHLTRRGDRDKCIWNYAGDYVINLMLVDAGMEMPPVGLLDKKFRGWTTVQVYDYLMQHAIKIDMPDILDVNEPETNEDVIEVEMEVKQILARAMTQSKLANEDPGKFPAELEVALDELLNPILPWQDLLNAFMSEVSKDDYSFRRPNKRFAPDFFMPTPYSESLQHLTIAIDTSGSVGQKEINEMLSEIVAIHQQFKPKKLTILDCDRRIHNIYEIDATDDITQLKFSGRGGTSFDPVFEYCKKNKTNALLYFTDLHARQITEQPDFAVLWLCYSNHAPAPIGQTVYYDAN